MVNQFVKAGVAPSIQGGVPDDSEKKKTCGVLPFPRGSTKSQTEKSNPTHSFVGKESVSQSREPWTNRAPLRRFNSTRTSIGRIVHLPISTASCVPRCAKRIFPRAEWNPAFSTVQEHDQVEFPSAENRPSASVFPQRRPDGLEFSGWENRSAVSASGTGIPSSSNTCKATAPGAPSLNISASRGEDMETGQSDRAFSPPDSAPAWLPGTVEPDTEAFGGPESVADAGCNTPSGLGFRRRNSTAKAVHSAQANFLFVPFVMVQSLPRTFGKPDGETEGTRF